MRCSVGVTASDRHTRLGHAFFRANDVNHTLFSSIRSKETDSEIASVLFEVFKHFFRNRILERTNTSIGRRRNNVVNRRKCTFRILDLKAFFAKHRKGLRTCHFMAKMSSDEQLILSARKFAHDVAFKHFLV